MRFTDRRRRPAARAAAGKNWLAVESQQRPPCPKGFAQLAPIKDRADVVFDPSPDRRLHAVFDRSNIK